MNSPKVRKFKGELVQIAPLDGFDITLITIQELDGTQSQISTSNKYWKAVGRFFQTGSIVAGEFEERIADTTEYADAAGVEKKHTSSGNNLSKISAYSASAWQREMFAETRNSDLQVISAVEESRVNAVAQYLATSFGQMR